LRVINPIERNQKLSYSYSSPLYPKFCPDPNLLFFLRPGGD
jgi:hypothetical protein